MIRLMFQNILPRALFLSFLLGLLGGFSLVFAPVSFAQGSSEYCYERSKDETKCFDSGVASKSDCIVSRANAPGEGYTVESSCQSTGPAQNPQYCYERSKDETKCFDSGVASKSDCIASRANAPGAGYTVESSCESTGLDGGGGGGAPPPPPPPPGGSGGGSQDGGSGGSTENENCFEFNGEMVCDEGASQGGGSPSGDSGDTEVNVPASGGEGAGQSPGGGAGGGAQGESVGGVEGALVVCTEGLECGFVEFFELLERIVDFLIIVIAAPFASLFFVYAGFLYLTSAGDPGKVKQAKDIFVWVIIGFVIALSAWLVINAILEGLPVREEFKMLEDSSQETPPV